MHPDLARLVNPLVRTALDLHDGWGDGTGPTFESGRERLRERFRELHLAHPAVNGTAVAAAPVVDLLGGGGTPADTPYLGVAYPLACWVDEMFTLNSPVAQRWTDRKFEVEYHATNDRAWRFWQQADLAAARGNQDDMEVFFLCAALGFRGEKYDDPAGYSAWAASTRDRLLSGVAGDWAGPPALDPPAAVPARYGPARLKRVAIAAALFALVAVPVAAWLVTKILLQK